MKMGCYLIMDEDGVRRMTKRPPSLTPYEIAVYVSLDVSDSVFRKFIPVVNAIVPEGAILQGDDVEIMVGE